MGAFPWGSFQKIIRFYLPSLFIILHTYRKTWKFFYNFIYICCLKKNHFLILLPLVQNTVNEGFFISVYHYCFIITASVSASGDPQDIWGTAIKFPPSFSSSHLPPLLSLSHSFSLLPPLFLLSLFHACHFFFLPPHFITLLASQLLPSPPAVVEVVVLPAAHLLSPPHTAVPALQQLSHLQRTSSCQFHVGKFLEIWGWSLWKMKSGEGSNISKV